MALSEFSFTLELIPGVENDIADAMSRLCRNNMVDSPQEYSEEHILSAIFASVVLYCTYMHPYIYTVSRTTVQLLHRM